ncbi:MAG: 30S ribosomal protein S7 [Candidatus Aenigmarchaeota archaeon]|nr:30S ribosomal protein S7 [Candidatus Aenigmarchaeota archaeon]
MKLFDKYDLSGIKVEDSGLKDYICLKPVLVPRTCGRHAKQQFHKSNINIVERLINHLYVPGHKRKRHFISSGYCSGNTETVYKIVMDTFDRIEKKTGKNPIEVFIRAIENSAIREEVTSFQVGGIIVRKAVVTSPQRRIDLALRNMVQGSYQKAKKANKKMYIALSDEIINAYNSSSDSYAVKEKDRTEKEAASSR